MIPRSPLKRSGPPRKKRKGKARRGRLRDAKYLAWIRTRWCILSGSPGSMSILNPNNRPVCEERYRTEAAHVGERGLGQKCSDRETIPLCAAHHRTGKDSHHVLGKRFFEYHGLNRDEIVAELQRLYLE